MNESPYNSSPPPVTPEPEPVESLGWLDIWGYAISKPAVSTYRELLADPKSQRTPYLWVGMALLLSYIIQVGLQALFGVSSFSSIASQMESQLGPFGSFLGTASLMSLICCAPFAAVLGVLGYIISCGVYHLLAKIFGGTGTFSQVAFAASTFYVPLTVIMAVLGSLPVAGPFLSIPVSIYMLVLFAIAINAVHGIGGWKSALVVIIPVAILIILIVILFAFVFTALAPVLQQMPGNIQPFTY
jgi:hypothetical protein